MEINNLTTNNLIFAKVKESAIIPSKRIEDAGYDIYSCFEEDFIVIPPHTTKLIPTGIASAFNKKYYIQIQERGSTGSKGIKYGAGVIDSGYRGEWFIPITNTNSIPIIISSLTEQELLKNKQYIKLNIDNEKDNIIFYPKNKAIAQAIVHIVPEMNVSEISYNELKNISSNRGMGSLGSSNK